MSEHSSPDVARRSNVRPALALGTIIALIWVLAARIFGPSDLWHQTQPFTIAYTTDIIVHGGQRWLLPRDQDRAWATKPPLYNWLAAPVVKLVGFSSELAHKFPSVLALCACWLIVVRVGRGIDPAGHSCLGWLAGVMLVANYPMFKLGYLARPDMLLTLWLLIAWAASTAVLVAQRVRQDRDADETMHQAPRSPRSLVMVLWLSIALAVLTKGPAAIVGVAYVFIAARFIGGRWRAVGALRPVLGLGFCIAVAAAWAGAVWRIAPDHLSHELWFNEFIGRVSGLGPKGAREGPTEWLIGLPNHAFYYVVRFAPWSAAAIAGMIVLWRGRRRHRTGCEWWMIGAALQAVVVVGLFTLSAGKRADYLAAAFPPSALLAAWWLMSRSPIWLTTRAVWLAPALAAAVIAVLTWINELDLQAPQPGFGDAIVAFAHDASARIEGDPMPTLFLFADYTPLQALMGFSQSDAREWLGRLLAERRPFWVVAGRRQAPPLEFDAWLEALRPGTRITAIVRSELLPRSEGWPEQATLYRVR